MPERKPAKLRNALKWTATAGAVGLSLLLASNLLWRYRLNVTYNAGLRVFDGGLAFVVGDGTRPMPLGLLPEREPRPHIKWDPVLYRSGTGAWGFRVPLVIPIVLLAIPAAALWALDRRTRRRALVGCCTSCGYDLAGITAPTCPECGRSLESSQNKPLPEGGVGVGSVPRPII